ncbi:MAG: YgjP-like metallopeptidase domain-containing protein [Saprospiraceae bacterium]
MSKVKAFKEIHHLFFQDVKIPLEIYHEYRKSARVSFSKTKAIVRIPIMLANSTKEQHLEWAKDWISKKLQKDKSLIHSFTPKEYITGTQILVRGTTFTLDVQESHERESATGRRVGLILFLKLPAHLSPTVRQKTCSALIHRIMSKTYAAHVKKRVDEINDLHFQKEINEIRLRNNSTNWGSCSTNKNISLSSRLLLAPDFVLNYIIIHELAHLVHHNHSDRYWNLVAKVMPDYMVAEKWLKKEGGTVNW